LDVFDESLKEITNSLPTSTTPRNVAVLFQDLSNGFDIAEIQGKTNLSASLFRLWIEQFELGAVDGQAY
jgi:hypothetical protein